MIYCIAHKKDLDGLTSHAIVRRYAFQQSLDIEHYFVSYDDLGDALESLRGSRNNLVVVADLGYNPTIPQEVVFLLAEENNMVWLDHHRWDSGKEILKAGFKFIHSSDLCAAELTYRHFLPGDRVAREIATLAHIHDFYEEGELAWNLYEVISSGYDKLSFVDSLSKGVTWNEEFQEAFQEYQKTKKSAYSYIEEHMVEAQAHGYSFLVALSPKYLSSTLASGYLLDKGKDFVVVVYPDGKLSFRRNSKEINLTAIAEMFQGGGREEAAGGKLDAGVGDENFESITQGIVERIRSTEDIVLGPRA